MFAEHSRAVVLPTRPEDIVLSPAVDDYLTWHFTTQRPLESAKVVVALAEGKGLVALGPRSVFHVQILEEALELTPRLFNCCPVTNFNPDKTTAAPTAIVQGGQLIVSDWQTPTVVISGASLSFGPITQRICLTHGEDFIANLIAERIRALNLK